MIFSVWDYSFFSLVIRGLYLGFLDLLMVSLSIDLRKDLVFVFRVFIGSVRVCRYCCIGLDGRVLEIMRCVSIIFIGYGTLFFVRIIIDVVVVFICILKMLWMLFVFLELFKVLDLE